MLQLRAFLPPERGLLLLLQVEAEKLLLREADGGLQVLPCGLQGVDLRDGLSVFFLQFFKFPVYDIGVVLFPIDIRSHKIVLTLEFSQFLAEHSFFFLGDAALSKNAFYLILGV